MALIEKYDKVISVAIPVLNQILDRTELLNQDTHPLFRVEAYDNCREQGFCIRGNDNNGRVFYCAFSENRNSDNIVVYYEDTLMEFGTVNPGNIPSDSAYNNAKYFEYGETKRAGDYIAQLMIQFASTAKLFKISA